MTAFAIASRQGRSTPRILTYVEIWVMDHLPMVRRLGVADLASSPSKESASGIDRRIES